MTEADGLAIDIDSGERAQRTRLEKLQSIEDLYEFDADSVDPLFRAIAQHATDEEVDEIVRFQEEYVQTRDNFSYFNSALPEGVQLGVSLESNSYRDLILSASVHVAPGLREKTDVTEKTEDMNSKLQYSFGRYIGQAVLALKVVQSDEGLSSRFSVPAEAKEIRTLVFDIKAAYEHINSGNAITNKTALLLISVLGNLGVDPQGFVNAVEKVNGLSKELKDATEHLDRFSR